MEPSGILVTIIICMLLGTGPTLVGRFVNSNISGLGLLSIVPLLLVLGGIIIWAESRDSSNSEEADWAGLWLVAGVVLGGMLAAIELVGFGLGRFWRSKYFSANRQSRTVEPATQTQIDPGTTDFNVERQPSPRTLPEVPW